jgi:phosphatidylserine decarboxylase
VVVVQVASRLVRRVQSYVEVGDSVAPGQRMGMIRFGSLVVMIFPAREDLRVEVELGERVTAGLSVLARYGPDQSPEG